MKQKKLIKVKLADGNVIGKYVPIHFQDREIVLFLNSKYGVEGWQEVLTKIDK